MVNQGSKGRGQGLVIHPSGGNFNPSQKSSQVEGSVHPAQGTQNFPILIHAHHVRCVLIMGY